MCCLTREQLKCPRILPINVRFAPEIRGSVLRQGRPSDTRPRSRRRSSDLHDNLETFGRLRLAARLATTRFLLGGRLAVPALAVALHDEPFELEAMFGHPVSHGLFLRFEPLPDARRFRIDDGGDRVALDAQGNRHVAKV